MPTEHADTYAQRPRDGRDEDEGGDNEGEGGGEDDGDRGDGRARRIAV